MARLPIALLRPARPLVTVGVRKDLGGLRCLTLRYSLLLSVWVDPSTEHNPPSLFPAEPFRLFIAVPFGVYTSDQNEWLDFQSDYCDPRVLSLSPGECNAPADSHGPPLPPTPAPLPPTPAPLPPPPPLPPTAPGMACAGRHGNCWLSQCCALPSDGCFTHKPGVRYEEYPTFFCFFLSHIILLAPHKQGVRY